MIAPPVEGSRPHLAHGSFGQRESAAQTACRSVQPFACLTNMSNTQTDRQTDRPRYSVSIYSNKPYVHCCSSRLANVRRGDDDDSCSDVADSTTMLVAAMRSKVAGFKVIITRGELVYISSCLSRQATSWRRLHCSLPAARQASR